MTPLNTSAALAFSFFICMFLCFATKAQPNISVIAHAGGGINGAPYTNSIQALNLNYDRGFELFEIDFSWTADGFLVCLHDWDQTAAWLLDHTENKPMSLAQFKASQHHITNITPCDIDSLNQWLLAHPRAYIVTDIKHSTLKGLEVLAAQIDGAAHRIIPQIMQPEQHPLVKAMGYESIIWTLYRYQGSDDSVVTAAANMDLYAITMPPHKAKRGLAHQIKPLNIPTYVHTINDQDEAIAYLNTFGLTSIYTDNLSVTALSRAHTQ